MEPLEILLTKKKESGKKKIYLINSDLIGFRSNEMISSQRLKPLLFISLSILI